MAGEPGRLAARIGELDLGVNGLAMRYAATPSFRLGAFTNPDAAVRRETIELAKRGIEAAQRMGSPMGGSLRTDRPKGHQGPEEWLRPLASALCRYTAGRVAVKDRWSLAVDERVTLGNLLRGCALG